MSPEDRVSMLRKTLKYTVRKIPSQRNSALTSVKQPVMELNHTSSPVNVLILTVQTFYKHPALFWTGLAQFILWATGTNTVNNI